MAKLSPVIEVTDQAAAVIAEEMTIREWQRALRYLMRKLEVEAKNQGKETEFHKMLWEVNQDIGARITMGKW